MSAPEGTGSGENPSLFASLRSFWSVLVAILYTRLDLVSAELEDEAQRGIKLALFGLVCVLSFFMAFFFAMFFILAVFWDTAYRLWVIGSIFGIYFIAGAAALFVARDMILNRPRFLGQTIAELKRDVDGLTKAIATKKDEAQKVNLRSDESIDQRRARLAAEIARQRGEFATAYRNLHKPIEMGESSLRVLGFMRQNAWIFNAVSTSLSTVTFLFGVKEMVTGKSAAKAAAAKERKAVEREMERKKSKSLIDHALHWGGHGWRVYKIYNRVKKYLPK